MRIAYYGDWSPEARASVEALFPRCSWLVPSWCHEIVFRWDACEGEACASTTVNYAYRFATIFIHGGYMTLDESERVSSLVHELLHVFVCPLEMFARQNLERLLDDAPKYKETVLAALKDLNESTVTDLALAISERGAA